MRRCGSKQKKATDDKEDLRHLAKSILLENSKKYFKLVNDQIFIYNRDTGLFEILQELSKEALSQISNVYYKKFIDKYYNYIIDDDDSANKDINYKALNKMILDKINQNRNFYCDKDIDTLRPAVIPLLNKKCFSIVRRKGN